MTTENLYRSNVRFSLFYPH